jgi:ArsR family transcriptional regulator, arsenate/arsenite/antimonite-responsive transcriptional repressor / arsenate reductase (thioredoxin)
VDHSYPVQVRARLDEPLSRWLWLVKWLLAHHLRVLEQAGVITRRRSEGDRRRTYLQLAPGALDPLAAPPARTARRVLFVCTANSARSHLVLTITKFPSQGPATIR